MCRSIALLAFTFAVSTHAAVLFSSARYHDGVATLARGMAVSVTAATGDLPRRNLFVGTFGDFLEQHATPANRLALRDWIIDEWCDQAFARLDVTEPHTAAAVIETIPPLTALPALCRQLAADTGRSNVIDGRAELILRISQILVGCCALLVLAVVARCECWSAIRHRCCQPKTKPAEQVKPVARTYGSTADEVRIPVPPLATDVPVTATEKADAKQAKP